MHDQLAVGRRGTDQALTDRSPVCAFLFGVLGDREGGLETPGWIVSGRVHGTEIRWV